MTDLASLDYPRHMYRGIDSRIVYSVHEATQARADGFDLVWVSPDEALERAAMYQEPPVPTPVAPVPQPTVSEPVPVLPARKKPGPKPKT